MKKDYIVCFSGTGRSIKYTFENLQKNLIEDLKPKHIFLVTEEQKYSEELVSRFEKFNNITIKFVKNVGSIDKNFKFDNRWGPNVNKLNYLNFLYKRFELSKLISSHKNIKSFANDTFIYSRLDVVYKYLFSTQIKNINTKNKVYVPNFHHWLGGYNDRFVLSNYINFICYLEIYKYLHEYNRQIDLHSEIITRHHFREKKLKLGILRLPFARIREDGTVFDNIEEFDKKLMYPLKANFHIYRESFYDSLRLIFNKK